LVVAIDKEDIDKMPDQDKLNSSTHDSGNFGAERPKEIVTVRPSSEIISRQKLPYFVGISGTTAGSENLSMNLVVVPPGGSAEPHLHQGYETAIYVLEGKVETRYGPDLSQSVINEAGDFIFIPADLPHQPVNLSKSKPALAIVARNDPNEQESVVPYSPNQDN
jgi:uncharacterized RmlC-like cupin family protein